MLKVLIADDEVPIRDWLEYCIDHAECGSRTVAKAANGKAALELFYELRPDILITDIKMPVMDGIELITKVRKTDPELPIIILTSYSEFSYARDAIKYGVTEYVLKTEITTELMNELLLRISSVRKRRETVNENEMHRREKLKRRLVEESFLTRSQWSREESVKILKELQIKLRESDIVAISFCDISGENIVGPQELEIIENIVIFSFDQHYSILLCNLLEKKDLAKQQTELLELGKEILKKTQCSVGMSGIYNGYHKIPQALKEASECLSQRFYSEEEKIFTAWKINTENEWLEKTREMRRSLEKVSKTDNIKDSMQRVFEIISYIRQIHPTDTSQVKKILGSLIEILYKAYTPYEEEDIRQAEGAIEKLHKINRIGEAERIIRELGNQFREAYENKNNYSVPVQRAVKYMHKNYANGITLANVAEYLELSPDYFSRIFKEETGINFTSYLTDIRLKKAMELFKTTNMKVYEVSDAVGYSNMSYFSTVFKKKFGVNPFEYKTKGQIR